MKPEEQRIAIAKACGWQFIPAYYNGEDQPPEFTTVTPDGKHLCGYYPDYLNSLDAMHEAEEVLATAAHQNRYYSEIADITWSNLETGYRQVVFNQLTATAAQRAEAFLKTLSLWKDDN